MCLMTLPPELSKVLETGSDAGQCGPAAGIPSNDSHTLAQTPSWHSSKENSEAAHSGCLYW